MGAMDRRLGNMLFGGKVVVFGGDFRQVLPVVKKGSRADIVNASFTRSPLWAHVRMLPLSINMRLQNLQGSDQHSQLQREFATFLLEIGRGRVPIGILPPCAANFVSTQSTIPITYCYPMNGVSLDQTC